ncbi:MAG: hypothetical protein QS748_04470 [Candidatus Endonucleobacter bathymodioli]|uniref:Transposase n=1 Tax=Candidatus Endonucleibacter bathymodioli TaxID=539814 RepID=A0AA90NUI6_9GAMM|nr:hypothetical protein [Candidatus Endonucleobacter bathymodioli]
MGQKLQLQTEYHTELKYEALAFDHDHNHSIAEAAKSLGAATSSLYRGRTSKSSRQANTGLDEDKRIDIRPYAKKRKSYSWRKILSVRQSC